MEKKFVEVTTYTWSKDSHGLFDYESPHLFTSNFKITNSSQFHRKSNDIQLLDTSSNISLPFEQPQGLLFGIEKDSNKSDRYYISVKNSFNSFQSIDLVVRALKKDGQPSGYELKVGDMIKIGRVKFLVREMKDSNNAVTKLKNVQEVNFLTKNHLEEGEHTKGHSLGFHDKNVSEINCRICLMSEIYPDPLDNTLVSPCKCKGSCEYVHLKCLKQWIDSKKSSIENSENVCLSFNYKKLSCEICKENLPYALKLGEHEYDIIDIKKPINVPYLILEKVETMRENKGLFLVKASDQEVRLGRGHTHHILVSDISVSRNHASIIFKDGKFLLFDNNSKFGTLVQVDADIEISNEKTILQCGKTVIILSLKKEDFNVLPENTIIVEDMVDSPRTPSTSNEQDAESKLNGNGSEKDKKTRRKSKKAERKPYTIEIEDSKEDDDLDRAEAIDEGDDLAISNLAPDSKKISKIVKANKEKGKVEVSNGRRKSKKNN